jgi:hypothetical protein
MPWSGYDAEIVHAPLSHLFECLGLMYLHSLDVLEVSGETAHHLAVGVHFALFKDPTF